MYICTMNKVGLVVSFPVAVSDLSFQAFTVHLFSLLLNESRVEPVTPLSSTVLTSLYCFFMQMHKGFLSSHGLGFLSCNPAFLPETPAARGTQSNLLGKRETFAVTL